MFLSVQLCLNLFIEARHPEVYDPEYRDRLFLLRQRVRDAPERPLLLVVGSSRVMTDFRPEILPPLVTTRGETALVFNFSHTGAGPLLNLTVLHRLHQEGFSPQWLVLEIVPSLLGVSGQSMVARGAEAGDLSLLRHHMSPWKLYGTYAVERLAASFNHCHAFLRHCAPALLCRDATWDSVPLDPLGGVTGCTKPQIGPDEIRRRTAVVRSQYFPGLQSLRIANVPDRAMRELLEHCRQYHIEVVLLLAPESSEFRSWYPTRAQNTINRYCDLLSAEYGVSTINARDWLPDECFVDGHHADSKGAAEFSSRLGREVLQPLVVSHQPQAATTPTSIVGW
jgi:hypothetical protein